MSEGWVELVLIRHAETVLDGAGRYVGRSDPPLSDRGRERARRLGAGLRRPNASEVWVSSRRRSVQTARIAFPDLRRRPDARLDELFLGRLEGLTHAEAEARFGDAYLRWIRDPEDFAPPEGESLKGLRLRLHRWLADLPTARSHVAVTHLGPIRALAAMALGLTFRRARRLRVDPATWIRLTFPRVPTRGRR